MAPAAAVQERSAKRPSRAAAVRVSVGAPVAADPPLDGDVAVAPDVDPLDVLPDDVPEDAEEPLVESPEPPDAAPVEPPEVPPVEPPEVPPVEPPEVPPDDPPEVPPDDPPDDVLGATPQTLPEYELMAPLEL